MHRHPSWAASASSSRTDLMRATGTNTSLKSMLSYHAFCLFTSLAAFFFTLYTNFNPIDL